MLDTQRLRVISMHKINNVVNTCTQVDLFKNMNDNVANACIQVDLFKHMNDNVVNA